MLHQHFRVFACCGYMQKGLREYRANGNEVYTWAVYDCKREVILKDLFRVKHLLFRATDLLFCAIK